MNVVIYSGPGTSGGAVRHAIKTLKSLLSSSYDVLSVSDPAALVAGHWRESTALLVMPGGRDVPYLRALGPEGSAVLRSYVEGGGKYLGLWCVLAAEKSREMPSLTGE
jgi:biotin--protein ligase